MRLRVMTAVSTIALWASVPAAAQEGLPEPAKNYASMNDKALRSEMQSLNDAAPSCTVKYPLMAVAARRQPGVSDLGAARDLHLIQCLADLERYPEALGRIEAFEEKGYSIDDSSSIVIAALAENGAATLGRLVRALNSGDSDRVGDLTPDLVWFALRTIRKSSAASELDSAIYRAVGQGVMGQLDPMLHATFASSAVTAAIAAGDRETPARMLPFITSPKSYANFLAMRRYESIWPIVEARVGGNYRAITSEFREKTITAWTKQPDNLQNLNDAAHGALFDGDFAGAIALVDAAMARPNVPATIDEHEAWALNVKGYALDALDRRAEADAVFDDLAALDSNKYSWLVNFVINRSSRLVGQQRWAEGLAAAEVARPIAEQQGNVYARLLVARDYIGALTGLGRADEAAPHLAYVRHNRMEAPALAAAALQLAGQEEEAVDLLIEALASDNLRDGVVKDLQAQAFDLFYTRSLLPQPRDLLNRHARLHEAFLQNARFIPEKFYPAASLTR